MNNDFIIILVSITFLVLIFLILVISCMIISKKDKITVDKEYSIKIYDLNSKLIMSFKGFNVDGSDTTIFFETEDGKQTVLYVPNNAIVTIEEV